MSLITSASSDANLIPGTNLSTLLNTFTADIINYTSQQLRLPDKSNAYFITLQAPSVLANDFTVTFFDKLPTKELPITVDQSGTLHYSDQLNLSDLTIDTLIVSGSVTTDSILSSSGLVNFANDVSVGNNLVRIDSATGDITANSLIANSFIKTGYITALANDSLTIDSNLTVTKGLTIGQTNLSSGGGISVPAISISSDGALHGDRISPYSILQIDNGANILGPLSVSGGLAVHGALASVDTDVAEFKDAFIRLARDNKADDVDIGIYGRYQSAEAGSAVLSAGLVRLAASIEKGFYLFSEIDISNGSDPALISSNFYKNAATLNVGNLNIAPGFKLAIAPGFKSEKIRLFDSHTANGLDYISIGVEDIEKAPSVPASADLYATSLVYNVRDGDSHVFTSSNAAGSKTVLASIDKDATVIAGSLILPAIQPRSGVSGADGGDVLIKNRRVIFSDDYDSNPIVFDQGIKIQKDIEISIPNGPQGFYDNKAEGIIQGIRSYIPNTHTCVIDQHTGLPYYDPINKRATIDPSTGDVLRHPATGLAYVDPATSLIIVDPVTGKPFIDPQTRALSYIDEASSLCFPFSIDLTSNVPPAIVADDSGRFLSPALIVIGISPINHATGLPYVDDIHNLPIVDESGAPTIDPATTLPLYDTVAGSYIIDAQTGLLIVDLKAGVPFIDTNSGRVNLSNIASITLGQGHGIANSLSVKLDNPLLIESSKQEPVIVNVPIETTAGIRASSIIVHDTLIAGTTLLDTLTVTGNATASSATFDNLVVNGDATINGTIKTILSETTYIQDPIILLSRGNNQDAVNSGFVTNYAASPAAPGMQAGLLRSPLDKDFYLFKDSTIDLLHAASDVRALPPANIHADTVYSNNMVCNNITAAVSIRSYSFTDSSLHYGADPNRFYSVIIAKGNVDQTVILPPAFNYEGVNLTILKLSPAQYTLTIVIDSQDYGLFDGNGIDNIVVTDKFTKILVLAIDNYWFTM